MKTKIKDLRQKTLAPMRYCKKALEECDWNVQLAEDKLKEYARDTFGKRDGKLNFFHEIKFSDSTFRFHCETDFTVKNEKFVDLAKFAAYNPVLATETVEWASFIFGENVVITKDNHE